MPRIQITHDCLIITILVTVVLIALSLVLLSKYVEAEVTVDTRVRSFRGLWKKTRLQNTANILWDLRYAEFPSELLSATDESQPNPQVQGILTTENCFSSNIYSQVFNNETEKLPLVVFVHPGSYYKYPIQSYLY